MTQNERGTELKRLGQLQHEARQEILRQVLSCDPLYLPRELVGAKESYETVTQQIKEFLDRGEE